jgi:hypothetical protein
MGGVPSQTSVTGTSTTLAGLTPGVAHVVEVAAVNEVGRGPFSAAAQGTPTTPPPPPSTSLSITGGKTIAYGSGVTLSGSLRTASGSGVASVTVNVQTRPFGSASWSKATSVTSSSAGAWTATLSPVANSEYRAVFDGSGSQLASSSPAVKVLVSPTLTLKPNPKAVALGKKVVFSGKVKPAHKATKVQLQRLQGKKWVTKKSVRTSARGTYRFVWKADTTTDFKWRVRLSGHADHAVGYSPTRKLIVK